MGGGGTDTEGNRHGGGAFVGREKKKRNGCRAHGTHSGLYWAWVLPALCLVAWWRWLASMLAPSLARLWCRLRWCACWRWCSR